MVNVQIRFHLIVNWIDWFESVLGKVSRAFSDLVKMLPNFTRRQWSTLLLIGLADFANAICVSLQAPFFPQEVILCDICRPDDGRCDKQQNTADIDGMWKISMFEGNFPVFHLTKCVEFLFSLAIAD